MHHAYQTGPIYLSCASQLARFCVAQPRQIVRVKRVTDFIETTAAGATKHLEKLVRFDLALEIAGEITSIGHDHRAHGKIDAGGNAHRPDDDVELSRFRERFHHDGTRGVTESAMMIRHTIPQEFRQALPRGCFLGRSQSQRVAHRYGRRDGLRDLFGSGATRREHQYRSEVRAHGAANHARPEIARLNKLRIRQISEISFLQRHRSRLMFDEDGVTSYAVQPGDHVARVGHAPAQKEQLCVFRCESDGELVMHTPHRIAQHLKFIHDQETRAFAAEKPPALCLESRDHNLIVEIYSAVTRGYTDI